MPHYIRISEPVPNVAQSEVDVSAAKYGKSPALRVLPCALMVVFIIAAVLPWWNRYVAITNDAWHYFYGLQIVHGRIPYRDFYVFVPPLYALKNALLIALFGNRLIVPHIIAILEILIISIVLVDWIRRAWPIFETTAAVTIAISLYMLSMRSEALGGLHQEAVFFPVLAGWAASVALRRPKLWFFLLVGACVGLSVLAKQTSGIATVVCIGPVLVILVWRLQGVRTAVRAAGSFLLGVSVPVSLVCIWLGVNHALPSFVEDVYTKGSASKGSVTNIILRPFLMVARDFHLQVQLAVAVMFLGLFFGLVRFNQPAVEGDSPDANTRLARFFAVMFAALVCGVGLSHFLKLWHLSSFYKAAPATILLFCGEIGCAVLLFKSVIAGFRTQLHPRKAQFILTCAVSVSLAYFLGWSWVGYTSIMIPSLAVFLAHVLTALNVPRLRWLRNFVLAGCILTVVGYFTLRLERPFTWGGWAEPSVWTANQSLPEPELSGFRVSNQSAYLINRVTHDIIANSRPGDPVLAYPDIPIFYILAHRSPVTFAFVHWMDVAPDYIDEADAARIRRTPPAVIVYLDQRESSVRDAEILFRHGHRSGVRDIIAAIKSLRPEYRTLDTFESRTGDEFVVLVRKKL